MAKSSVDDLPPGFVLQEKEQPHDLPPGFELEQPPSDQGPPSGVFSNAPAPVPRISPDEATAIGMGQGAFGVGDEIASGARAIRDTAMTPERRWSDLLQLYRAYKGNAARDQAAAQSQHPVYYAIGNLPVAAVAGMETAALAPAAAMRAAPWATNFVTNTAQAIAQNYGQDTLTPKNVAKDVAAGELLGGAMRVAARGPVKTAGDIMQLPQRGIDAASDWLGGTSFGKLLGSNADELGDVASKRVKDLRLAQQSYLTEAGKHGAAADASVGGKDLASRLARSASQGNADIGPGGFTVNPAEFGDDVQRIVSRARQEALDRLGKGRVLSTDQDAVTNLLAGRDMPRVLDPQLEAAAPGSPERAAMTDLAKRIGARAKENIDMDLGGSLDRARETLATWQAAKSAQQSAQQGAAAAGDELTRIKTGRGALQNIAGIAAGGAGGNAIGGPVGAMIGVASGKQLGKGVLQGIDIAGEAGQKLSQVASVAERLAARSDGVGQAARWALSGEGPAFVARLATLADLPEVKEELQATQ